MLYTQFIHFPTKRHLSRWLIEAFKACSAGSAICRICIKSFTEKRFSGDEFNAAEKNWSHLSDSSPLLMSNFLSISWTSTQLANSNGSDGNRSRWLGNIKYKIDSPKDQISLLRVGLHIRSCSIGRKRVSSVGNKRMCVSHFGLIRAKTTWANQWLTKLTTICYQIQRPVG